MDKEPVQRQRPPSHVSNDPLSFLHKHSDIIRPHRAMSALITLTLVLQPKQQPAEGEMSEIKGAHHIIVCEESKDKHFISVFMNKLIFLI